MQKKLYTVAVFSKLNTRRFFRDRLSIFFGILFPLIFLFVFGSISGNSNNNISFKIALENDSSTQFAREFAQQIKSSKTFKVDPDIHTLEAAREKMGRGQLDATLVLPKDFGTVRTGQKYPTGTVQIYYTNNNATAGQQLATQLQGAFNDPKNGINVKLTGITPPFSAAGNELKQSSLTNFDYTFAGLVGFAIIGMGIFGPVNVFPELKKQGILRRLHTTPLKVWQYFLSTMISQAIIGLVSLAVMFAVAITVFHLHVVGNWLELIVFLVFGIITILGLGLAIGGWAKNERQAAPLSNIIVFPLMFLSGTFFPRFLMPQWLQSVSNYLPLTPVIDGIRLIATEGQHLSGLGPQLGLMAIWLVVIYAIAFRVFRWE